MKDLQYHMVAPPKNSVAPGEFPLTFFDILFLPTQAIRYLFIFLVSDEYHAAATSSFSEHFRAHDLPRLTHSLSLILQIFYPLAGRLVTLSDGAGAPYISYTDGDSVELILAESADDIRELAAHEPKDGSRFDPLIPSLASAPSTEGIKRGQPVLAVQVTLFPESRGVAIGLCLNHCATDGYGVSHFIKTWAALCKKMLQETNPPVPTRGTVTTVPLFHTHAAAADLSILKTINHPLLDRGAIRDPAGLRDIYWADLNHFKFTHSTISDPDNYCPPGILRATFVLTRTMLDDLRNMAAPPPGTRYTSFTMACALAWVCSVKAHGKFDEPEKILVFPADLRKRLYPPVPATYLGNCFTYRIVQAPTEKLAGESGLAEAAAAISAVVRDMDGRGVLEGAEEWMKTVFTTDVPESLIVNASPLFGVYEADFGWGSPRKVETLMTEGSGSLALADSGEGDPGGIELGLALAGPVMVEFVRHFRTAVGPSIGLSRL